jgi:hypothetical protein
MTGLATVNNWLGNTADVPTAIFTSRLGTPPNATGSFNEVILADGGPADICCGRPGANLPAAQVNRFPVVTNPDFADFSTMVSGSFTVLNTDGQPGETLTFTLQSDDGSALRIIGQDFTGVSDFSGDGDAVLIDGGALGDFEGAGDTYLMFDNGSVGTGNANTFGKITLAEGTYSFEAWQRQGGGDSGLEIWAAAGDFLATGFNAAAFFPLSSETLAGNTQLPNTGLGLVAGPGTGPTAKPGDFDLDGDVDGRDFLVWQRGGSPNPRSAADLALWKTNFGTAVAAAGAVPEPGSLVLALAALGMVAAAARRR